MSVAQADINRDDVYMGRVQTAAALHTIPVRFTSLLEGKGEETAMDLRRKSHAGSLALRSDVYG